jgi:carbon monoxide dehydrogenase subunit G
MRKDFMKLNGTHKFQANSWQVFNAILNPNVLQSCIPGCRSIEILDPTRLKASITTPLPGLKGPYGVIIRMAQRQDPNLLVLEVKRKGSGGSVNAVSQIIIQDQPDGALLTYDASADLEGPIAIANNPIGQTITKNSLKSFFDKLEQAIA